MSVLSKAASSHYQLALCMLSFSNPAGIIDFFNQRSWVLFSCYSQPTLPLSFFHHPFFKSIHISYFHHSSVNSANFKLNNQERKSLTLCQKALNYSVVIEGVSCSFWSHLSEAIFCIPIYGNSFKGHQCRIEETHGGRVGNTCVCTPGLSLSSCHLLFFLDSLFVKMKILIQMIFKTMRADEKVL